MLIYTFSYSFSFNKGANIYVNLDLVEVLICF